MREDRAVADETEWEGWVFRRCQSGRHDLDYHQNGSVEYEDQKR